MKQCSALFPVLFVVGISIILLLSASGCANIIPPTGGARDSIPPILIAETPMDSARNVQTNRFVFTFNEYVELQDVQSNVLISPTPVKPPLIDYKLRTVTVRLRDTLEPNTTYSINFGNAIKDINEGNVFKDFSYVFSTGNNIDSFTLSGKVLLAETGKIDSTLAVVLHKNLNDSAVVKDRPRYIARLDGQGNYKFTNLPAGTFAIYAVPNNYSRNFNESEPFAFADKPVVITNITTPVNLLAYIENVKPAIAAGSSRTGRDQNKVLRYSTNLEGNLLDILNPFYIAFDRKITQYESSKIILTDKDFNRLNGYSLLPDSAAQRFTLDYAWIPKTAYHLIIAKDAFSDSSGATISKLDTIKFTTKSEVEYGRVKIRFNNLDVSKNPVLQLIQNNLVVHSYPLTQRDFVQKLFKPGEYEMRILYDENKNGKWDAGKFFTQRRQPEKVIPLSVTLSVRADWDNDKEITLAPL